MNLVIGRQILVWAVELAEPANLPRLLSSWFAKYLESDELGRYSHKKRELQKSSLPKGRFQHGIGEYKRKMIW